MSQITLFKFDGYEIDVIVDEHGEPWFNANHVCSPLGFANPRQAVETHVDKEDVQKLDTLTPGGRQQTNYVNESGLFALIFGSTKPEAKRFKRWVTSEVLPSIRKTGSYALKSLSPAEIILAQAQQLVDHERRMAVLEQRQALVEAKLEDFQTGAEHFSITAYSKLFRHQSISNDQANRDGQRLSRLAKNQGITLGKAPHPVWGTVNTYPKAMLDAFYSGDFDTPLTVQ